jgi:tetratricopeptide (TPR) repeat protein
MAGRAYIPVIIGTLVSNLKDQRPFVSVKTADQESANTVFEKGQQKFKIQDYHLADSLFRIAKDLDALRFRAPQKMNPIIKELAAKYNCGIVNIDSAFNAYSPERIVGNNLLVDHLHPTLEGYFLIGRLYFEGMKKLNFLPLAPYKNISDFVQDSMVTANFSFSRLDSVIASLSLIGLLNDWPFVDNPNFSFLNELDLRNKIDSIAYNIALKNQNWERGHRQAAEWYLVNGKYSNFAHEMMVLTSQYRFKLSYYDFASAELINAKEYGLAYPFLLNRYKESPDAFTSKWLGNICLNRGKVDIAIKYLTQSIKQDDSDAQVLYNLTGAYIKKENYKSALESIEICIKINPEFPNAKSLKIQLTEILRQ